MRSGLRSPATLVLWSLCAAAAPCLADESPEDVIRTIQHGVAHRQELITSLSGWATVRYHRPHPERLGLPETEESGPRGNYEVVRVKFAWSSDRWRIESAGVVSGGWGEWVLLGAGEGWRDCERRPSQALSVCDGETVVAFGSTRPEARVAPRDSDASRLGQSHALQLRRILLLDPVVTPAEELVRMGAPRVVGHEAVDGVDCLVCETTHLAPKTQAPILLRIWCAPSLGFAVVRVENAVADRDDATRGFARRVMGADWQELSPGVWLPRLTRWEEYVYGPTFDDPLTEVREARMEYLTANTDISAECALPQFPVGTFVTDLRPDAKVQQYVVGDTDKIRHADKGVAGLEGSPDLLKGMPEIRIPE